MSIAKKAISGAIWMSGISYIGFAINFGIQLVLVRLLIPEDFGLFALGLSIAEILFIFFSFSFSMAVVQIQEAEDLFDTALYLSLLSGFIILLIGMILSLILSSFYPLPSILAFFILCALQPLQGCSSIYSASLEKDLLFKKNALVRGIATNFSGFTAIFLAYIGFGVWSLVGREIIRAILMLLGMRVVSNYRFHGRFNWKTAKRLFNFGYKMLFSRGLEVVYHRVPNFLIGTFAGTRALGLFSQAYYLANLPNTMLGPVHQNVAYPTYSKIQSNKEKVSKSFYIVNYFFIRLLIPFMLILFLYPTEVLRILYGDKWLEASSMLYYFAIYAAFLPLFSNTKSLAYGVGKLLDVSKVYLVEILFLFTGILVALYVGKIYLGALAYSFTILIGLSLILYLLKREEIKVNLRKLFFIPTVVSSGIILLRPLFSDPYNILFLSNKTLSLISFFLIFTVSLIAILVCEPKQAIDNFKYIQKKVV